MIDDTDKVEEEAVEESSDGDTPEESSDKAEGETA